MNFFISFLPQTLRFFCLDNQLVTIISGSRPPQSTCSIHREDYQLKSFGGLSP